MRMLILARRLVAVGALAALSLGPASHPAWRLEQAQAQTSAGEGEEKEAFEAAKTLGTEDAWQAFLKHFPDGFRADLAKAYVARLRAAGEGTGGGGTQSPASAAAAPAAAIERVRLHAVEVRVGKWPERAAFDGRALWVSESGARSIAEVDPRSGRVSRRFKVGRLPVDIVATENGTVYALAETDSTVYAVSGGRAGPFADVPRCGDGMAYADDALWVVSNIDCSAPAVLTRLSHLDGRARKVADLAAGPVDIEAAHGFVYVAHMAVGGRAAFVSVIEARSGSAAATPDLPIHFPRTAANASAVFLGGAPLDQSSGIVIRLAAGEAELGATQSLPEPIAAVAATDRYVVAAGTRGTLFVLSASDLTLLRTITTDARIEPHDVVAMGDTLAVVSSRGNEVAGDNNVYLLGGWQPGTTAATTLVAPAVGEVDESADADAGAASSEPLACASGYENVNGTCELLQNCGANAYRSEEGDCYCKKGFEMKSGRCVARKKKPQQQVRDNCPGDSVLKNGRCVKEEEPAYTPPVKCTGGQLYSLSQERCVCQDGLLWNGQRCYLP